MVYTAFAWMMDRASSSAARFSVMKYSHYLRLMLCNTGMLSKAQ